MTRVAVVLGIVVALAGCGGAQKRGRGGSGEAFDCKGRHATYVVTGSIIAAEAGVKMSCEGNVPYVEEYRIDDKGQEQKRGSRIDGGAWESAWDDLEHAGWRMLGDCENPGAGAKDPFYVFEIADEDKQISVTCKGATLPFPHDTLLLALDKAKSELPVSEKY